MRIHPPNQILINKVVPPEGDTFQGHHLPGGTAIAWNVRSVMRSKAVFGDDAYLFRPERFLEEAGTTPEKRADMERHAELIFGYGRYMCSGKPVALMELNKVYVEVCFSLNFCS
jgi:cytochrome P450